MYVTPLGFRKISCPAGATDILLLAEQVFGPEEEFIRCNPAGTKYLGLNECA
jgi:hypothetical protein